MTRISDEALSAFQDELEKQAVGLSQLTGAAGRAVNWARLGGQAGLRSGAGVGAATGGLVGGLSADEGFSLRRAMAGAAGGAALGAGAGHLGSRMAMGRKAGLGMAESARAAGQDIAATGRGAAKSVRELKAAPVTDASRAQEQLRKAMVGAPTQRVTPSVPATDTGYLRAYRYMDAQVRAKRGLPPRPPTGATPVSALRAEMPTVMPGARGAATGVPTIASPRAAAAASGDIPTVAFRKMGAPVPWLRAAGKAITSPGVQSRVMGAGAGSALGGAAGAGIGAGAGGYRGYQQAREMGATRGQAFKYSLGRGLRGAALGGAAGFAGGAALGAGLRGGAGMAQRTAALGGPVGAVSRFGQRQAHSITGALPQGFSSRSQAIRSIGAGGAGLEKELAKATGAARAAERASPAALKAERRVSSLAKGLEHAGRAEELGMTSLPGAARAFATKPGQALKAGLGQQWYGSPGVGGKAMAFGLPAGFIGMEALSKGAPGEAPKGGLERAGGAVGANLPWLMMPAATTGLLAASGIGAAAGKMFGRGGEKLRRKLGQNVAPPEPEEASVSGNAERMYSQRATGDIGEGTVG